ncbi:MAG TPA: OsmC family protein [Alphaproteobacteria bacterium]|nr:OsmC family protein [Alphaproteobacteria bacterium]
MDDPDPETDTDWSVLQATLAPGQVMVTATEAQPWGQALLTQKHVQFADETAEHNGADTGPNPHELVLMALGACTAITVRMYAARKGWAIDKLDVRLSFRKAPAGAPTPAREQIERQIEIEGPLDAEQRARLFAVAEKCPIHKLLTGGVDIHSELVA